MRVDLALSVLTRSMTPPLRIPDTLLCEPDRAMKRYLILNGDKTTANGIVQAHSTSLSLTDRQVAHEGDDVACPACHSTGKIQCVGPRMPMSGPDGRKVALSDDLCICQCEPHPTLVASQQTMSIEA
jgi:uncharacterized Zn-binding protein involved in type VI secretion